MNWIDENYKVVFGHLEVRWIYKSRKQDKEKQTPESTATPGSLFKGDG